MKHLIITLSILMTSAIWASDLRSYNYSNSVAKIEIIDGEDSSGQATTLLDGEENQKFIKSLLNDPNSELAKLKSKLELQYCEENSSDDSEWISGCGGVELTSLVSTSFNRGGWMGGARGYSFFVGFRHDGSGRFFESEYLVTIVESVEAQVDDNYEYQGKNIKTIELVKIQKL